MLAININYTNIFVYEKYSFNQIQKPIIEETKLNKKIFKHIISIFLICITVLLFIFYVQRHIVSEIYGRSQSHYINDTFDSLSVTLDNDSVVTNNFTHSGSIYALSFRFNNASMLPEGDVKVEVINTKDDEIILSATKNAQLLLNDTYTNIIFDTPYISDEKIEYEIRITADFKEENAYIQLWENSETNQLALGVSSYIISDDIYPFINIIYALILLYAISIYVFIFIFNLKKENLFLISLLSVSLIFSLVLPPYSSPDEEAHINSAYELLNKASGYSSEELDNSTIYKRENDSNYILEDHFTTVFSYEYVYNNLISTDKNEEKIEFNNSWLVDDFPAVYTAGAVGLAVADFFDLGYLSSLYFGRLFNVLLYVLLVYFAIKITPIGKEIFMVLSFLPITLHLINSFSRDTFVIGMAFLFIAYCLKLVYVKEKIDVKDIVLLFIIAVLLAPSKTIYAPLIIIAIPIINKYDYKIITNNKQKIPYILAGITVAVIAFLNFNKQYIAILMGLFSAPEPLETLIANNPNATFNIGILLSNPIIAIDLVLNTIAENFSYYIKSISGGVLSYNSIIIDDFYTFAFLILILVSTMKMPYEKINISKLHKILFSIALIIVFASVVYVAITWTPVVDKVIYGIQGKYLMPAIPLLLLLMKNNIFKVNKDIFKPILFSASMLSLGVAFNAFIIILSR